MNYDGGSTSVIWERKSDMCTVFIDKSPFFGNPVCKVQACDGKGRAVKSWQPKQLLESGPKFKKCTKLLFSNNLGMTRLHCCDSIGSCKQSELKLCGKQIGIDRVLLVDADICERC